MNTHYLDTFLGDKMSELGAGFVRIDFDWWRIQPSSPTSFDWSEKRRDVNSATARGLQVFASLAYTPGWANGGQGVNVPPTNMSDWYNFVRAAALEFPEIRYWGIWNEPNDPNFLTGRYDELAMTGRDAIKSVDPSLQVLGPEVASGGVVNGWYANVMNSYGYWVFDIVTVHYYNDGSSATKWVQEFMDQRVYPYRYGKEVWMTETGRNYCDPKGQANHYQGVLDQFGPRGWYWTKVFFYDLYESVYCSDAIVDPSGYNRPAFATYHNYIVSHP